MKHFFKCLLIIFFILSGVSCSTPQSDDLEVSENFEDTEDGLEGTDDVSEDTEDVLDDNLDDVAEPSESDLDEEVVENEDEANQDPFVDEEEPQEQVQEPPVEKEALIADEAPAEAVEITNIRFLANQKGGTVVIDTTGRPSYNTRVNEETIQFIVDIKNAILPEKLKRPFITKEFASIFAGVNAYQSPGSQTARVVFQYKDRKSLSTEPEVAVEGTSLLIIPNEGGGGVEQSVASGTGAVVDPGVVDTGVTDEGTAVEDTARIEPEQPSFQPDRAFVSNVQAKHQLLGARTLDEFLTANTKFYGRPISIQVKDADIRDVINFIAEKSGVNLVISEEVKGNISVKLREVPWDQALVVVMKGLKLGYIRQGSVIRITTLNNLKQETDLAKQIIDAQKALTPLRVKVIPVSYAKVDDLQKQVKVFLTKDRGKIVADKRTNSLIITDTADVINKLTRLIKELDIRPMQVMIEGKIVEATENFEKTFGINWNFDGSSSKTISDSGGVNGGPISISSGINSQPTNLTTIDGGAGVFSLNIATLDIFGDLSARLALAEEDRTAKVLSSPKILAANKGKAEITQKSENVTISTVTDTSGNTTRGVTRTPIILNLIVEPQITTDGSVIMDVSVKREFAGPLEDEETRARAINERSAKTKVIVKSGQTAVIGGVYSKQSLSSERGVPGLKDIPLLGWLFKNRSKEIEKSELLLFLTPRIMKQDAQKAKM